MYFNGMYNLDSWDDDADYAVFDDLQGGFTFFHSYKQWLGGQREFTTTDKYRHKRTVTWGKPCIYISNDRPGAAGGVDIAWLEGNCLIVEIREEHPVASYSLQ